jgi:hypothetical protein
MSWLDILKFKRNFKDLRQLREEGIREGTKQRTANKVLGDISREPKSSPKGDLMDMQEDRDIDQDLANMAKDDLIEEVMDRIEQMSKDELIDMLIRTRGQMGESI